ncbi:MAG TPA: ACP synthase, partial [Paraburkholderia sp.]
LSAGAFRDSGDRLIAGFLTLGWLVDLTDLKGIPVAVLRRPKTQVRVKIYGTDEYIGNLRPQEAS